MKFISASSNWKGGLSCFCSLLRPLRLGHNPSTLERQSPIDLATHISSDKLSLRSQLVLPIARASYHLERKHSSLTLSQLMELNWCISPFSLPLCPFTFLLSFSAICPWLSSCLFSQKGNTFPLSTGPNAAQSLSKCVWFSFRCYFDQLTPHPRLAWEFALQLP